MAFVSPGVSPERIRAIEESLAPLSNDASYSYLGNCDTDWNAVEKVVTVPGLTAYDIKDGTRVSVRFTDGFQSLDDPIYLTVNGVRGAFSYDGYDEDYFTKIYIPFTLSNGIISVIYDNGIWRYDGVLTVQKAAIADSIKNGAVTSASLDTELQAAFNTISLKTWQILKNIIQSGNAPGAFAIGEQFTIPWKTYKTVHDVCHISDSVVFSDDGGTSETTGNGMFMQWHYTVPYSIPFDEKEALYTVPSGGLAAGTYYFTVTGLLSNWSCYANNNNKTFMFTLPVALTEGQQILLSAGTSSTDWTNCYVQVYDSAYEISFNENIGELELALWDGETGSPLSGDATSNSTDGTGELNHIHRMLGGYNRWSQSALRQWLNSAAAARDSLDPITSPGWWQPQNKWDRAPGCLYSYPGFLSGYSNDFISAMRPVKVETACNTVTDGGIIDTTYDKVFIPSLQQMNIEPQVSNAEGETWEYYIKLFASAPVSGRSNWAREKTYPVLKSYKVNQTSVSVPTFIRSAYRSLIINLWYIYNNGNDGSNFASEGGYPRPACVIG